MKNHLLVTAALLLWACPAVFGESANAPSLVFSSDQAVDYAVAHRERVVRAVRISDPIKIDGLLEEAAWDTAEPATDFIQKLPQTGEPASEATEVRLLYDDNNLYVGVYCFDSAGRQGIVVNDITKDFFTLEVMDRALIAKLTYLFAF